MSSPHTPSAGKAAPTAILRPPRRGEDRIPLPARAPRLLNSLSPLYLAELAGDEVSALAARSRLRLRPEPARNAAGQEAGAAARAADAATTSPPPRLDPGLRWRHALSPGPGRPLAAFLVAALGLLALLALFLLAAPEAEPPEEVLVAMVWQGPMVIGPEQQGGPPVETALPQAQAPVAAETPPQPAAEAPPAPEMPAPEMPAPEMPAPDAAREPVEAPAEAAPPQEQAEARPAAPEAVPPAETAEREQPEAPADLPQPGEEAVAAEAVASGAEESEGGGAPVPLPRRRPPPLVADMVLPPPSRPLPDDAEEAVAAARPPAPQPAPARPALPSAAPSGSVAAPQAVQQLALQVFASDGPEPRRIQGFPLPAYPVRARLLALEGEVVLRVRVGASGGFGYVWVESSSGHPELDEAAFEAIQQWRFQPPMHEGQRVSAEMKIPVSFRLRRPAGSAE